MCAVIIIIVYLLFLQCFLSTGTVDFSSYFMGSVVAFFFQILDTKTPQATSIKTKILDYPGPIVNLRIV